MQCCSGGNNDQHGYNDRRQPVYQRICNNDIRGRVCRTGRDKRIKHPPSNRKHDQLWIAVSLRCRHFHAHRYLGHIPQPHGLLCHLDRFEWRKPYGWLLRGQRHLRRRRRGLLRCDDAHLHTDRKQLCHSAVDKPAEHIQHAHDGV